MPDKKYHIHRKAKHKIQKILYVDLVTVKQKGTSEDNSYA